MNIIKHNNNCNNIQNNNSILNNNNNNNNSKLNNNISKLKCLFPKYLQFKIINHCWLDLNKYRKNNKKNEKYLEYKIKWRFYLILVDWEWFKYIRDNLVKSYSFEYQLSDIYRKHFTNKYSILSGTPINLRISTKNISTFLNSYYEFNGNKGVELFFSELIELEILINCDLDFNDYDILFTNIRNIKSLTIVFRETMTFSDHQYYKLMEYLGQPYVYEKLNSSLELLNFQSILFSDRLLEEFKKIQLPNLTKFTVENFDSNLYSYEIIRKINTFTNLKELRLIYPLDFEFFLNSHTIFHCLLKNSKLELLSLDLTDRETFTVGGYDSHLYVDFYNLFLQYAKNIKHLKLVIHKNQKHTNSTVFKLIEYLFTSTNHKIETLECNLNLELPLPFKLTSTIKDIKGLVFNNCSKVQDIIEPFHSILNHSQNLLIPKDKYPDPVIDYLLLNTKSKHVAIDFSLYGIEQLKLLKKNNSIKFLDIVGLDWKKYQVYLDQILYFMSKQKSIILTTIILNRNHSENWSFIRNWLFLESSTNKTFSNSLLVWSEINNYYKFNYVNFFHIKIYKKNNNITYN